MSLKRHSLSEYLSPTNAIGDFQSLEIHGGQMDTRCTAALDVNGDDMMDIIIGNWNQKNQVMLEICLL